MWAALIPLIMNAVQQIQADRAKGMGTTKTLGRVFLDPLNLSGQLGPDEKKTSIEPASVYSPGSQLYFSDPVTQQNYDHAQSEIQRLNSKLGETKNVAEKEQIQGQIDNWQWTANTIAQNPANGAINPWMIPESAPAWAQDEATRQRDIANAIGQRELAALAPLAAIASGTVSRPSVVEQQSQLEREALARQIASQLAGARGGYNPALQRSGLASLSQGLTDIASQSIPARLQEQISRSQEQAQAAQAYSGALGQVNRDTLARDMAALQALGMGYGERQNRYGALQDLERLNTQRGLGLAGIDLQAQQTNLAASQRSQDIARQSQAGYEQGFAQALANYAGQPSNTQQYQGWQTPGVNPQMVQGNGLAPLYGVRS